MTHEKVCFAACTYKASKVSGPLQSKALIEVLL